MAEQTALEAWCNQARNLFATMEDPAGQIRALGTPPPCPDPDRQLDGLLELWLLRCSPHESAHAEVAAELLASRIAGRAGQAEST
jgi:hypothetical protein